jgi:[ribosomal protein S5]-alanine N-acetyltransferase
LAISLWCDPNVMRYMGGVYSHAQAQERLAREIACQEKNGFQYWPIFFLDGGKFAGVCGMRPYNLDEKTYTLGFHLRPAF